MYILVNKKNKVWYVRFTDNKGIQRDICLNRELENKGGKQNGKGENV